MLDKNLIFEKVINDSHTKFNFKINKLQLFKDDFVERFIFGISNCQAVLTDSFHGTIFALIFNKPFLFFPMKGAAQKLNNRVENLLEKIGLIRRIWNPTKSIQEQMDESIDWLQVNEKVEEFRCFSLNWLKNALES